MTDHTSTNTDPQSFQEIIANAIKSEIGDIDRLPQNVAARVRKVYREFMPIYIEMIRIREKQPRSWQPAIESIDPELVEDLLHFFSDYQHITRDFRRLNRQVRVLLTLDRQKETRRYDEWVEKIVAGDDGRPVMNAILES